MPWPSQRQDWSTRDPGNLWATRDGAVEPGKIPAGAQDSHWRLCLRRVPVPAEESATR